MQHKRHRHFVLLPVLLAGLMLMLLQGGRSGTPASTQPTRDGQSVTVGMTHFLVEEGADIVAVQGEPWLRHGSALTQSVGLANFRAGPIAVQGLAGGFHVSVFDSGVTVAALSTPILVTQGTGMVLVPIGYHWRSESNRVATLPVSFIGEHVPLLSDLRELPQPSTQAVGRVDWDLPLPASLVLGAEEERRTMEQQVAHEQHLQNAALGDDRLSLLQLLRNPASQTFAGSATGQDFLSAVLTRWAADTAVLGELISLLTHANPSLWLLTSQHPAFAELAWLSAPVPDESNTLALALRSLPLLRESFSPLVAKRWGDEMSRWLEQDVDAANNVRQELWPVLHELSEAGFPEQSRLYQAALLRAVEDTTVPSELPPVLPLPKIESEEPARATVIRHEARLILQPAQVVELANTLLGQLGVLQTIKTRLRAVAPNVALVEDVLVSGPQADRMFDFHINVTTGMVSAIQEGAEQFSYSLPLERFVEWARQ